MSASACTRADDLAAYALGALDDREEAAMSAHVEKCEHCRARLRWLAPALETLPESVEQVATPARLRRELMKTVRAEADSAPVRSRGWRDRRVRIGGFAFGPATALAASLIAVAGVVGYEAHDGGGSDPSSVPVSAVPPGSTAELELADGEATLRADGVPQLPAGAVYQVWVRRGAAVRPSSVFRPSADGSAAAAVPEAAHGDQLLVTREPRRGSSAPSSAPLYTAALDH